MKLTTRGRRLIVGGYVAIMLGLGYLIITKPTQCIDEYTANLLATHFLYGEGAEVDNAINAIYNNNGWIEIDKQGQPEIVFPCLNQNKKALDI
jgi:hypothetical protein